MERQPTLSAADFAELLDRNRRRFAGAGEAPGGKQITYEKGTDNLSNPDVL
jgi:hypothetical protein